MQAAAAGTIVSKAEFARLCAVTGARVSHWIRDGVVTKDALVGEGRHARIRVDVAKALLKNHLDPDRRSANLGYPQSELDESKTKTSNLQNELLQIRLDRERGLLVLRSARDATLETVAQAVATAVKAIPGWGEELGGAYQNGGAGAICAQLRAKSVELGHSIADLIRAEAESGAPEPSGSEG